jgi:hypothetical protein
VRPQILDQGQAFFARHAGVDQDQIEGVRRQPDDRLGAVTDHRDVVAARFTVGLCRLGELMLALHHQDVRHIPTLF